MKKAALFAIAALALAGALCGPVMGGDTLADVKAKGVLVVGVRDTAPPFGTFNPDRNRYEGYDIDVARYIAEKLGVKVDFQRVTASSRIPALLDNRVDLLAAAMTKTPERAERIDFSHTYFLTGQKFLARKGKIRSLKDLEGKRIATGKGTTAEQLMKSSVPQATVVSFEDYPMGFVALKQGKVDAVTTDESILGGQLSLLERSPATRGKFEIPDIQLSIEPYALGVRKNDAGFLKFVNETLLEMEQNGEVKKIFQRWFGAKTECPINRGSFVISRDTLMSK